MPTTSSTELSTELDGADEVTMRHFVCCTEDPAGGRALCGTDLASVPWAADVPAEDAPAPLAEVECCFVCIEMQCEAPVDRCPRYPARHCADN